MIIPENLLTDKKILLGVTGSISAYKALELTRLFVKAGADVKVVMSESAKKFVTPLSFETLSRNKVLDESSESWADDHNHIKATQWADIYVIAPCTANTIGKLSNAIADNMLLQCALAFPKIKLLAPSANTNMLQNPITQAAMKMLAIANYEIMETQTKELACQTTGDGALAEPIQIFWHAARILLRDPFWVNRRVIVTGGGTIEKIDDVRYLSNYSSGKMASAMASALYIKGADVNLIATRFEDNLSNEMHTIDVEDTEEMFEYLRDSIRIAKKGVITKATLVADAQIEHVQKEPFVFMAAAVSDYIPKFAQDGKLKKEMLGDEWSLELKQNQDILMNIDKTGIKTVAFKAEMDATVAEENAKKLLGKKRVDAVCLNVLKDATSFGSETNSIDFITKDNNSALGTSDKLSLALKVLEHSKTL